MTKKLRRNLEQCYSCVLFRLGEKGEIVGTCMQWHNKSMHFWPHPLWFLVYISGHSLVSPAEMENRLTTVVAELGKGKEQLNLLRCYFILIFGFSALIYPCSCRLSWNSPWDLCGSWCRYATELGCEQNWVWSSFTQRSGAWYWMSVALCITLWLAILGV